MASETRFQVGDRVKWKSQAAGTWREKEGEVVEVVRAGAQPKTYEALARDHESYVVRAVAKGRTSQKPALYWPRRSALVLGRRQAEGA
jgi:hypothetical protein